jgi:hypothetical protein
MIRLEFRPPKALLTVDDLDGNEHRFLVPDDDDAVIQAFVAQRQAKLKKRADFDFADWKKRAKDLTNEITNRIARNEVVDFPGELWTELKSLIFVLSHGKCAYCEAFVRDVSKGDVEHYRPKAPVPGEDDHRGYFWLAYDESNYLPACPECNTSGKGRKFPVAGQRAVAPADDLSLEKPLLLNPFEPGFDPTAHLSYAVGRDPSAGSVRGLTLRGETSTKVYKLNRPDLIQRRKDAIENYERAICVQAAQGSLSRLIADLKQGSREFSGLGRAVLQAWIKAEEEKLAAIRGQALFP